MVSFLLEFFSQLQKWHIVVYKSCTWKAWYTDWQCIACACNICYLHILSVQIGSVPPSLPLACHSVYLETVTTFTVSHEYTSQHPASIHVCIYVYLPKYLECIIMQYALLRCNICTYTFIQSRGNENEDQVYNLCQFEHTIISLKSFKCNYWTCLTLTAMVSVFLVS